MEDTRTKRKAAPDEHREGSNKKAKGKKAWDMPRRKIDNRAIQPGDTGIWATCAMKKEAKSIGDLRDLFQEYASKFYGTTNGTADDNDSDSEGGDIEAEINKELADIRKPTAKPLFTSVKLDTQCLIFFRTRSPIEPVSFIHSICQDIADGAQPRNLRYVKRLTPITAYEKATTQGLETVAKQVLAPHFHGPEQVGKKFAIRPSIRNNKEFTRDEIIKSVAAAVGPGHKVDLKGYDLLILVEIYKNVLGMSVVGPDFERLKRFNLEELRQTVSTEDSKPKESVKIKQDD
ncbi:Nn.00g052090.m01.CDS01 [Neocucurbitaria sp. VM-36]